VVELMIDSLPQSKEVEQRHTMYMVDSLARSVG
jgi:hypothetical protein